jgi:hypothetical protein
MESTIILIASVACLLVAFAYECLLVRKLLGLMKRMVEQQLLMDERLADLERSRDQHPLNTEGIER